jgi:hypothetical protein
MIGVEEVLPGLNAAGVGVPHQGIVGRGVGAVDVARFERRAGGTIFRHQRIAVVEEQGGRGARPLVDLVEPAERIISEVGLQGAAVTGGCGRAGRGGLNPLLHQPVLDVVEIDAAAVGGEVAVAVAVAVAVIGISRAGF